MRRAATVSLLLALVCVPGIVWAQDDADPMAVPGEGAAEPAGSDSAGAGQSRGLGVGVMSMLGGVSDTGAGFSLGLVGPALVFDPGAFHIEGILGYASNGATVLSAAGRFWYHLHRSANADFSVGGGLGFASIDDGDANATLIDIEGGAEIRFFLVENVSLSAALGLAILAGDFDGVDLTGDLSGSSGIIYFF